MSIEIPNHRIMPTTIIDEYQRGLGRILTQEQIPEELIVEYEYFKEKPHMLSQYAVRKWYMQGLSDRNLQQEILELVNRR